MEKEDGHMKDNKYFQANVNMAVEIEYACGGRMWYTVKGSEVKSFCESYKDSGDYVSDIDYSCNQDDEWVRKVLNTADYNWMHNLDWCKSKKLTSMYSVVDYIIANKLVA